MDSSSVDAEFKAARDLHSAGRWPEASQRFEALMKRMRTANTLTPERERALVDLLVSCYRSMSEHGKALPLAQRSVELTLALRGPTSEMYPASRLAVGHAYTGLGRFKEASRETQAVLTIFEERGDTTSTRYASVLQSMANIAATQKNDAQQVEWLLRAEAVLRNHPVDHNFVLVVGELAACYERLERAEEARSKYAEALELAIQVHGPNHPECGAALNNLALFLQLLKLYDEAIPLLERAIRIFSRTLGQLHDLTTATQEALNACYACAARDGPLRTNDSRQRLCGGCGKLINRLELRTRGTDFLACGHCFNVAYCGQACVDAHWPVHQTQCKKREVRVKHVNVLAPDVCANCLCAGAQKWCPCGVGARYCDAQCQKEHWSLHKATCALAKKKG